MSENAPSLKASVALVLVKAVVTVATATVALVLAVIFALPELKLIILPTSVANQPTPPFIPVTAEAVIFRDPVDAEEGVRVVVVVFVFAVSMWW